MVLRRRVVEVLSVSGLRYALKLECGHVAKRRDSGRRQAPGKTYCDECVMVLERMDHVGDLVTSREVKSTKAVLRFLEAEGHVEGCREGGTSTVYWRRAKR